jgi:hypothetical protein
MVRLTCALLLLASFAAAQDRSARLSPAKRKSAFRFAYALPDGKTAVEDPEMRQAKLGRDVVYFFDVDGNGAFGDLGVDAWALPKMPYAMPLEESTIIGTATFSWTVAEDGKEVRYSIVPLPITPAQREILIHFNNWRMMNGLPAVTVDADLSDHCAKHCAYMERHGFEHTEEEGKDGYTAEGAAAGLRSCLSEADPKNSVTMFYASFYHRLPLIHPGTRAIGIGTSKTYSAIDGLTRKEDRAWQYPIVVPAPNTFAHPTHFAPELPRPFPEGMVCGFPITLTFDRGAIAAVKARVVRRIEGREARATGRTEEPVACRTSWPGNPANEKHADNRMTICIIPETPLRPVTTYEVAVAYTLDGAARETKWLFNTGAAGPGPVLPR